MCESCMSLLKFLKTFFKLQLRRYFQCLTRRKKNTKNLLCNNNNQCIYSCTRSRHDHALLAGNGGNFEYSGVSQRQRREWVDSWGNERSRRQSEEAVNERRKLPREWKELSRRIGRARVPPTTTMPTTPTIAVNQTVVRAQVNRSAIIRQRRRRSAVRHSRHGYIVTAFAFTQPASRVARGMFQRAASRCSQCDAAQLGWMLQRRYRNRVRLRCKFGVRVSARRFNRVTGLILNKMRVGTRGEGTPERES